MRAVVQRVTRASVSVEGTLIAAIDVGVLVLLGVAATDRPEDADRLAGRIARLRIFPDDAGRFDRSVLDVTGEALVVSQFTLIADSKRQKGTRPASPRAARPEVAEPIYLAFCDALGELGVSVQRGAFGALMTVELVNDGPVTIVLDAGELP